MVNDCHIHIGYNPSINKTFGISDLEKYPIDKCLVTSSEGPQFNDHILKAQNDKIKGLFWINSDNSQIDKFFGAKFHGSYENKPITQYIYVLEHLNKTKKPLLVHCGMYLEGRVESNTSFIHAIEAAKQYPDIKVILAHMGGSVNKVIKKCIDYGLPDNCFLETSGITNPIIVEYAVEKLGSHRILFGSDLPWCSFNAMLYNVRDADISDGDKINILVENFDRFIY